MAHDSSPLPHPPWRIVEKMNSRLIQLESRVKELEALADNVFALANEVRVGNKRQPELQIKGQQWYRGTRELLAQHGFSGVKEFDDLFYGRTEWQGKLIHKGLSIDNFFGLDPGQSATGDFDGFFAKPFQKARSLLLSLEAELMSRELPIRTQLSFALTADEFATAEALLNQHSGDEALLRVCFIKPN